MKPAEITALTPFLDWPVLFAPDFFGRQYAYCARRTCKDGIRSDHPCETSLGAFPGNPRLLLQMIRQHATSAFHWGVLYRLEARVGGGYAPRWEADIREPGPEEIAIAGTTPDGSYWRLSTGAVVAETTGGEDAQRYRIRVEVEPA